VAAVASFGGGTTEDTAASRGWRERSGHRDGAEGAEVDRRPGADVSGVPKSSPQTSGPEG
jgi:hypothetical protein